MKKYFIYTFLLVIFLLPNVNALEVDPCFDKYKLDKSKFSERTQPFYYNSSLDSWVQDASGLGPTYKDLLPIDSSKTYYLTLNIKDNTSFSPNYLSLIVTKYYSDKRRAYTYYQAPSRMGFDIVADNSSFVNAISCPNCSNLDTVYFSFYLQNLYSSVPDSFDYYYTDFDLRTATCPEPEIPDVPDEPDKPVIPGDTSLDSFYTLFVDRLKFLSSSFIENPIFLGFISIPILFCVLYLFIKLFKGGGY